jgi:hypothetical protein
LLQPLVLLWYNSILLCSKTYKYIILINHSFVLHFKTTSAPQLTRMHMYEHETPFASLVISILMFQYTYVWSIPSLLTFFSLFGQFSDRCHNNSNFFDKTSLKLCHPIAYLNLLLILGWLHVYYCLYLL